MKSFIIADTRDTFLADVATRMIMDDERDLELLATASNIDKLHTLMTSKSPNLLIVSREIADEQEDWNYDGCDVVTYGLNQSDCDDLKQRGLKCYGIVRNAKQLLNLAEGPLPQGKSKPASEVRRANYADLPDDSEDDETAKDERGEYRRQDYDSDRRDRRGDRSWDDRERSRDSRERDYDDDRRENRAGGGRYPSDRSDGYDSRRDRGRERERDYEREPEEQRRREDRERYRDEEPRNARRADDRYDRRRYDDDDRRPYRDDGRDYDKNEDGRRYEEEPDDRQKKGRKGKEPLPQAERNYGDRSAENRYEQDLIRSRERHTTTVTVYAAKGGVGKSTIATQTAVCLALTSGGREKYRVCIVDYNTDFGDVRAMLGMDNDGPDMYYWAMDIKDRLKAGERPEEIWYSRSEIEEYLQVMNRIGLYVLCAPNSHQESMAIESVELEIMLRNITKKGGFDFVVCDTGNNTRDSSIIALEAADYVLLVATQDVTAASCNASVIEALDRFGLDLHKVRLIVNNILSVKYTGINVESVESYFSQYPCIARIRHNLDIVKSNNLNEPIVLQANHEVTKEFRKIVAFLTGTDESGQEEKKGFRIFRRNRRG